MGGLYRGDDSRIYVPKKLTKKTEVDMHVEDQLLKSLLSTSADQTAYFLFVGSEVCPDLLCSVDIRRAIQVWFLRGKEGNDAQQDRLDSMDGHPSFPRILITILIVSWGVKDRDTYIAIEIDVRMPHWSDEAHLGRQVRELGREGQPRSEESTLVECIGRANYHDFPFVEIVLIDKSSRKARNRMLG